MIKNKSFWQRPEGITGGLVLGFFGALAGLAILNAWPEISAFLSNTLNLGITLVALAGIIFVTLDSRFQNLMWYSFQSIMRWITRLFVKIDPMNTLKTYVAHLDESLVKMRRQVTQLRQELHKLKEVMVNNIREIEQNLDLATSARAENEQMQVVLKTRKAGRLQDSNLRLDELYKRMEMMYKVLIRMEESSTILLDDIRDQVKIKEVEQKAFTASNSAMQSAMEIIRGDSNKKAVFDQAVEILADDVSQKIGEMERFMDLSNNVMKSIDLNNKVFEAEGLELLDKWEAESKKMLGEAPAQALDLNAQKPIQASPEPLTNIEENPYDQLFK